MIWGGRRKSRKYANILRANTLGVLLLESVAAVISCLYVAFQHEGRTYLVNVI